MWKKKRKKCWRCVVEWRVCALMMLQCNMPSSMAMERSGWTHGLVSSVLLSGALARDIPSGLG